MTDISEIRVADLEFSVRAGNVLRANGIETFGQLKALDKKTVMGWKAAGARTWREIAEVVEYAQPSPQRLREDLERSLQSLVEQINFKLDANPDYAVRLVEGRLELMRAVT